MEPRAARERAESQAQAADDDERIPWHGASDPGRRLEAKLEPELQQALIESGCPGERGPSIDVARRIHGGRAIQSDHVRAVENIGRLGDEFEFEAFAQREQARIADVKLRSPRGTDCVAANK